MKIPKRADVIVVGAGPVGLFAALCLRRHQIEVEIFDTVPHRTTHSYALALHPETLALFDKFGLLDRVRERMFSLRKIAIHRGGEQLVGVDLTTVTDFEHPCVAVISQADLEQILVERLSEAGRSVHWSHRVARLEDTGRRVFAAVSELEDRALGYAVGHGEQFVRKTHDIEAAFVVGADGHDSLVRRLMEIPFPEVGSAERFAVFEMKGKEADRDVMEIFTRDGGGASVRWPLGGGTSRWSFQVGDDFSIGEQLREKDADSVQFASHEPYPMLEERHLREFLQEYAPQEPVELENLYWRLLIRFEKRLADRFGQGRMWLAGDAAHLTGPIGVQSMNVGFREAHDLAERMVSVIDGRDAAARTFAEYDRERLVEWNFLLGVTGRLRGEPGTDPRLASLAADLRSWIPASGYGLATLAHRLGFKVEEMPMATGLVTDGLARGS